LAHRHDAAKGGIMSKPFLQLTWAICLVFWSAIATAEPETGSRIDPARSAVTDSANDPIDRQVTNQFARCIADTRPQFADQILEMPFTSGEQEKLISAHLGGWDKCLSTYQFDLKLNTLSILGGMAESRIAYKYRGADPAAFAKVTDDQLYASPAAPRNTSEDFAMCLARKNPSAVRALIESRPETDKETASIKLLTPHLSECLIQGMTIQFNRSTIRAYAAYGLYRLQARYSSATDARS
jgi:hypothetical protein